VGEVRLGVQIASGTWTMGGNSLFRKSSTT
jgi:hypothetical protein